MRTVTPDTQQIWLGGDYTGPNRPVVRATIQRLNVALFGYNIADTSMVSVGGVAATGTGQWSSVPLAQAEVPYELPNIRSVQWNRDVDEDVASCTIVLNNTRALVVGDASVGSADLDLPGYYTATRGLSQYGQERWGHLPNPWATMIAPDRLIRTYEGYGVDYSVPPEEDPNLYPSGVWLIDDVTEDAAGTITVQARDIGRALMDQIVMPPVVPWDHYPLQWEANSVTPVQPQVNAGVSSTLQTWMKPLYATDSNMPWVGKGYLDGSQPYVADDGSVEGHYGRDAFDNNDNTYWLSVGSSPTWGSGFEYVEGSMSPGTVGGVRLSVWGGPYLVYISLHDAERDTWLGKARIPYTPAEVDTRADVNFVAYGSVGKDGTLAVSLAQYPNVDRIRVTFTNLYRTNIGTNYVYRAGLRSLEFAEITTYTAPTTPDGEFLKAPAGNYGDYTDIIKWFCAWGGFYWPPANSGLAIRTLSDGRIVTQAPPKDDPVLGTGAVFGTFEPSYTTGIETLTPDKWDKKPLMDCISYIRDILGFIFQIDEAGACMWRMPNVFQLGNTLRSAAGAGDLYRTDQLLTLDETTVLSELSITQSSRNLREQVFVSNTDGSTGAIARGMFSDTAGPYRTGLRRIAGWTDQNFASTAECQVMADMISLRQQFSYRQGTLTIPAHPGLQIDDQVQIFERVTGECYVHYVKSISMEYNADTGEWLYHLGTYWLGEDPADLWAFDLNDGSLSAETLQYLSLMGKV